MRLLILFALLSSVALAQPRIVLPAPTPWKPDGGSIGSVVQGAGIDGGAAWNVAGSVTAVQGASRDGGTAWPIEGSVTTELSKPGTVESFGAVRTASQQNQIDIPFFRGAPASLVTVTTTNGGTATASVGGAIFSTGANVNGTASGVSAATVSYRGGAEVYAYFTAAFTAPTDAGSFQRIGLYNAQDGFFIGWNGTTFQACTRNNAVDTCTSKASWSLDTLTGAVGSRFDRNGVPEAIDLARLNIYRIRFGWLGAAPIEFEVLSPDGEWVIFHRILFPNTVAVPSIENPDLPMTIQVSKAASDATVLSILSGCLAAGTTTEVTRSAVNPANSTTTLLGNGGVFTGVATDLLDYATVRVSVFSDRASATNGLQLQFSNDGVNWDFVRQTTYIAGTGAYPVFNRVARYFRVVYTNGALAQTSFRLQTVLVPTATEFARAFLTETPGDNTTGIITQSMIYGLSSGGGGSYVQVKVNPSGALSTTTTGTVSTKVAAASATDGCVSVTTSTQVLASNAARGHSSICADADNTKKVYIKLGTTATTADFPLAAGQCMSPDNGSTVYTGRLDAIALSGTQSVCYWELLQ